MEGEATFMNAGDEGQGNRTLKGKLGNSAVASLSFDVES